mmetsp:Transcript_87925/g.251981  ORF Transcript_87925/g.251981 Transcript_87925/m.251981 type:complete len:626 (-) Transcript_87925:317-2194(-)
MTTAVYSDLLTLLEQTQTSKDTDSAKLLAALTPAQAALSASERLEDVALVQRLVSTVCSWLRAHEDTVEEACVNMMLKILGHVLGQDKTSDGIAVQKGLLSTTTVFLERYSANVVVARSCLDVLATLSVVENADAILSRLGTLPIIVELLRKHRDDNSILEDAVTTLALMAKRTRHRRTLSQGGSITVLVDVLKRGAAHPSLVVAVCRFLGNFAVKEDCCMTVLQNGGVDALMAAFDHSVQHQRPLQGGTQSAAEVVADTRAAVASAIWTCSMECKEVQNTLLSSGWISSLAAVLQANAGHAGLHEAALGIVRSLSRNKQYREDILSLGFVEETIRAMKQFCDNPLLMKEGCGFIGNLATDPEIRVQLGESGVCEVVISALAACKAHDDRKVAKLALGALSNLASCEQNRDLLSKTDVVPILLNVSRTFMQNENILEYAVGALSHLAVHSVCNQQLLGAGAVEALLLFLGDHREDLQVISKCLIALRRILKQAMASAAASGSSTAALMRQVAGAGSQTGSRGIHLLIEAMQEHIYDETVVKEAALLLTTLSSVSSNIPALMQVAVKPCMKALEVHEHEVAVSDALAGLLASLPLEEDESWAEGGLSGGSGGTAGLDELVSVPPAR